MEGLKYRSREHLKANFCHQNPLREYTGSAWNFLQPSIQICRGAHFAKRLLIHSVKITGNTFVSQKIECLFMPPSKSLPQVLLSPLLVEGNYPFPPNKAFWKCIFSAAERGRTMKLKIWPKLHLQGYWSQVLINSTIYKLYIFGFCFLCAII